MRRDEREHGHGAKEVAMHSNVRVLMRSRFNFGETVFRCEYPGIPSSWVASLMSDASEVDEWIYGKMKVHSIGYETRSSYAACF